MRCFDGRQADAQARGGHAERIKREREALKKGFTMIELLTSVAILAVISVSVSITIAKTKLREELDASARQVAATLRNLQAQALAARKGMTCAPGAVNIVCEVGTGVCGAATCNVPLVPMAVGMTLRTGVSYVTMFADADVTLDNRREDANGRENLGRVDFASSKSGGGDVTVTSLMEGASSVGTASVAFERQNGNMRIDACGTPALAPSCGAGTEPVTLDITLSHAKLGKTAVVRLNRLTGKISIE
jgi:prepilin-type N-terminal cleavage/methylation domain-containing protein